MQPQFLAQQAVKLWHILALHWQAPLGLAGGRARSPARRRRARRGGWPGRPRRRPRGRRSGKCSLRTQGLVREATQECIHEGAYLASNHARAWTHAWLCLQEGVLVNRRGGVRTRRDVAAGRSEVARILNAGQAVQCCLRRHRPRRVLRTCQPLPLRLCLRMAERVLDRKGSPSGRHSSKSHSSQARERIYYSSLTGSLASTRCRL